MNRAPERTGALTAEPSAVVDGAMVDAVRRRLGSDLAAVVENLAPRDRVTITLPLLRRAWHRPESLGEPEEPFVWRPAFVRRSLGLAVVDACVTGRFRSPVEAAGPLAGQAVERWQRTGWRSFHWEPWFSTLAPGARAAVLAETVTWASALWSAFEWRSLPGSALTLGGDEAWRCPERPSVRLRAKYEVGVALAGRAGLVTVSAGASPDDWPSELGFLALVAAVWSPVRAAPARVMGVWPDSGATRCLEVDEASLTMAAQRVVAAVEVIAIARSRAGVGGSSPDGRIGAQPVHAEQGADRASSGLSGRGHR